MKVINEILPDIPSKIKEPYSNLDHEYSTVLSGPLRILRDSDLDIVEIRSKKMLEIFNLFQKSITSLLDEMNKKNSSKNPGDSLQEMKDHFAVWSYFINSFKSVLLVGKDLEIAKTSDGDLTKRQLRNYEKHLAELDAMVQQTQLYIEALTGISNNNLTNNSHTIVKFKKNFEMHFKDNNLLFLFTTLMRCTSGLKILPLLEAKNIIDPQEHMRLYDADLGIVSSELPREENSLHKSDSDAELTTSELYSSASSDESDSESQMSHRLTESNADTESRTHSPAPISPNRERTKQTAPPPLARGLSLDSHPEMSVQNNPSNISPHRARTKHTAPPPLVRGDSGAAYSPPQSRNAENSQQIHTARKHLKTPKEAIDEYTRKIAEKKSAGNLLGIQRLTAIVENLANTEELKKYAADRTQYWAQQNPAQLPPSSRKAS